MMSGIRPSDFKVDTRTTVGSIAEKNNLSMYSKTVFIVAQRISAEENEQAYHLDVAWDIRSTPPATARPRPPPRPMARTPAAEEKITHTHEHSSELTPVECIRTLQMK